MEIYKLNKLGEIFISSTIYDNCNSIICSTQYDSLEKIHFKINNTINCFYTQLLDKN